MKKLIPILVLFLLPIVVTAQTKITSEVPARTVTLPLLITAAAIDSINPCAFAVLIFLIASLIIVSKKMMLKIGSIYIATVYITYFLAGLGILTFIQTTGLSRIFYYLAIAIALIAGIINIKDYFWYGKGISFKIPSSKKPLIKSWISKASIPSAIALGFLVSAFELPCTGEIYLTILALIAADGVAATSYLLLYNFIFVLPLIAILLAAYYGLEVEKMKKWKESNKKLMRLGIGLFLITLALIMLVRWL